MNYRVFRLILIYVVVALQCDAALKIEGIGDYPTGETTKGSVSGAGVYSYDWTMHKGGKDPISVGMRSETNLETNWWMATNSETPWDAYIPETFPAFPDLSEMYDQPTMHWIEEINGNDPSSDAFYVRLIFEKEMKQWSAGIRLANDLLDQGSLMHIGLRNSFYDGSETEVIGSLIAGGNPYDPSDPNYQSVFEITPNIEGTTFGWGGYSKGEGAGSPDATKWASAGLGAVPLDNYEWVKYTDLTDFRGATQVEMADQTDHHFHFASKNAKSNQLTNVTEAIFFFQVAETTPTINEDDWIADLGAMDTPDYERAWNDLVMSWTTDAKSGFGDVTNPDFDPPADDGPPADGEADGELDGSEVDGGGADGEVDGSEVDGGGADGGTGGDSGGIPEPSRAVLLMVGALGMILCRRRVRTKMLGKR